MPAQMRRMIDTNIAEALCDALEASEDCLNALSDAYVMARKAFHFNENEPDPDTIVLALQAQALGTRTLGQWLIAIATVTSAKYATKGERACLDVNTKMEQLGLVIPDIMTL